MALAPGVRLGPYEIAAQIGEGGMGEGYWAADRWPDSGNAGSLEARESSYQRQTTGLMSG